MKRFTVLFLVCFTFRSACLPSVAAEDAPAAPAIKIELSQEDDIREAVFRWQFDHNVSAQQKKAKVYFLAVGQKYGDPSDDFIKRFADNKPTVRKRSECSADVGKSVLDKKTGEQGLIFHVTGVKWKSDTEVEVEGGYYEAGESASRNIYTLKKEKGKWKVTNDKLVEIS